jgi:hypothetical protein
MNMIRFIKNRNSYNGIQGVNSKEDGGIVIPILRQILEVILWQHEDGSQKGCQNKWIQNNKYPGYFE